MSGRTLRSIATALLLLALVVACRTTIDERDTDLTPDQFFQRAIEATDVNNYRLAMSYYESFLERYPDDLERNLWASYEVAFLHHKMGNDQKALELLDALLQRYRSKPTDVDYPPAPFVLAGKVRANIMDDAQTATTPASAE